MRQYECATLQITAVKGKEPFTVPSGKQKQEIIADNNTGFTSLTLWEDIENKSYQLNRIQIHQYLGKTELTFPRFSASVEVDDLPELCSYDDNDSTNASSVTIIGVSNLETTYPCIDCKKNIQCTPETSITKCDHCQSKQRLRSYKTSAILTMSRPWAFIVQGSSSASYH